jgi:hypothetical protein
LYKRVTCELETIWEQAIMGLIDILRKATRNIKIRYPGQDLNQESPEYKSRWLPLHAPLPADGTGGERRRTEKIDIRSDVQNEREEEGRKDFWFYLTTN